jgi:murein DD-endopeptidase MepM/ murein hydrolase activator NlpD
MTKRDAAKLVSLPRPKTLGALAPRAASEALAALLAACLGTSASAVVGPVVDRSDYEALAAKKLTLPVLGVQASALRDNYSDARGGHIHDALDIPAPRGTEVLAVEDGTVAKLFTSRDGGLTVYAFDPSGTYCYYYAHLDRYAKGLAAGMSVRRGEVLGYVGTTGNAPPQSPHLHFAIFKMGSDKRWWEGAPINPYPVLTGRPSDGG